MTRKSVQVSAELHKKLKMESAESGDSIEAIVREAVEKEIEKRQKERQK